MQRSRLVAIEKYGSKCSTCSETDPVVLEFDHIDGGGCAESRAADVKEIHIRLRRAGWPNTVQLLCRSCHNIKTRMNKTQTPSRQTVDYRKLRLTVIDRLGSVCRTCGEDRVDALEFDHVYGGGGREFRAKGNYQLYREWRDTYGPLPVQLLCGNCHCRKTKQVTQ